MGGGPLDGALNPAALFKDRLSNVNTAKAQIEKQRAKDQVKEKLRSEFAELDKNGDDRVSYEEMYGFLSDKLAVSV
jgi:hypothetical protein